MPLAPRLDRHLSDLNLPYGLVRHPDAPTAAASAGAADVPAAQVAKSVLIQREDLPLLAVIPASRQIDLGALGYIIHNRVTLADESDVAALFDDCAPGAVPCVGAAYGLETVVDTGLTGLDRVWFEAGDHRTLVEVTGADFEALMQDARRGSIAA